MGFMEQFVNGGAPGISKDVLNEPFNVNSATVAGTTLTVVLGPGRIDFGGGLTYQVASGNTFNVTNPSVVASTTYYVWVAVNASGLSISFLINTNSASAGSGYTAQVRLASVTTGNPVTSPTTVTDLRGLIPVTSGQAGTFNANALQANLAANNIGVGRFLGIASVSGAPTAGNFLTGDWFIDNVGCVWSCSSGGTPGSWLSWDFGDQSWTAVTVFTNGWTNFGSPYFNAAYRKVGNIVRLRGMIKGGTVGSSAFTLPAFYRPNTNSVRILTDGSGSPSATIIAGTGTVTPNPGNNGYVSLDGITFDVL